MGHVLAWLLDDRKRERSTTPRSSSYHSQIVEPHAAGDDGTLRGGSMSSEEGPHKISSDQERDAEEP
jgi:hypothetical protein